jgi:hypothetical protein
LENNVYELHNVYDSSFNKLTNKYYQKQPWPEAEIIAPLVNDGKRIHRGLVKGGFSSSSSLPSFVNVIRSSVPDFVP